MDLDLARAASVESVPAMMAPTGEVEPMRCWLLAEVLMTDGINQLREGEHDRARSSLARAAALFGLVGPWGAYLTGSRGERTDRGNRGDPGGNGDRRVEAGVLDGCSPWLLKNTVLSARACG